MRSGKGDDYSSEVIVMSITGSQGAIFTRLIIPDTTQKPPLIIMSHGFGVTHESCMDYSDHFVSRGFAVCLFDYCGGGHGSRSEGSPLEMSVLTEAEDLQAVLDSFSGDERFSGIFLWGQSQGGFTSAYAAAENSGKIDGVVLEYPAFVIADYSRGRAEPDGSFAKTDHLLGMTVGRKYHEDAVSLNIYDVIGAYGGDVLILHGDQDTLVPLSYSMRARKVFPSARLMVMPGQGHGFRGKARQEAMEAETLFFRAHARN